MIIILGSRGMLGRDLVECLRKTNYIYCDYGKDEINITSKYNLDKLNSDTSIIINCAAYTNVDMAEKEKDKCYKVNVEGTNNLVEFCKLRNIVFVYISTDYVFDGKKKSYNEMDKKNPINYYGETKSQGEDIVMNGLKKYYIIRTSWTFGKYGKNFINKIVQLCNDNLEIKVVKDQVGSPTYTKDLSYKILEIVNEQYPYGIYHITNSGICSRCDLAKEVVRIKKYDCNILSCKSLDFLTGAKRPSYSTLNNNKTTLLRIWEKALREYLLKD